VKIQDTLLAVLVSAEEPDVPFLLDMSDPLEIGSSELKGERNAERFNLFAEMLPDEDGPSISIKSINMACLEAQFIMKMFLSTFGSDKANVHKI